MFDIAFHTLTFSVGIIHILPFLLALHFTKHGPLPCDFQVYPNNNHMYIFFNVFTQKVHNSFSYTKKKSLVDQKSHYKKHFLIILSSFFFTSRIFITENIGIANTIIESWKFSFQPISIVKACIPYLQWASQKTNIGLINYLLDFGKNMCIYTIYFNCTGATCGFYCLMHDSLKRVYIFKDIQELNVWGSECFCILQKKRGWINIGIAE